MEVNITRTNSEGWKVDAFWLLVWVVRMGKPKVIAANMLLKVCGTS